MPITSRVLAILVLGMPGTFFLFSALVRFPDPPGGDGYYYLKQIEQLASGNGYYYKDRSLAFLVPAGLTFLSGNPLNAFRLSIAITCTLLIIAGGMLTYAVATASGLSRKNSCFLSILSAAALACSLTLYEFSFEYYKNSFALLLLVLSVIMGYVAPPTGRKNVHIAFMVLLVTGSLLSHKSSIFFVILFATIWFLKYKSIKNALLLLGTVLSSMIIFLIFFERSRHYLQTIPTFVISPLQWFEWFRYIVRKDITLLITLGAGFLTVIFYLLHRHKLPARTNILFDTLGILILSAFIPFFSPSPTGQAYRVILLIPLFSFPLLLIGTAQSNSKKMMAGVGIILSIFVSQVIIDNSRFKTHFPSWSGLDADIGLVTKHVSPKDHLIAHHGLEFYVDYMTGIRARQFLSSNSQKKSFRLAYVPADRPGGEARTAINKSKLEQIGDSYALFHEEDWVKIVDRHKISPHWKNPTAMRPDYIPDYE